MHFQKILLLLVGLAVASASYAQGTIKRIVIDKSTGSMVYVESTSGDSPRITKVQYNRGESHKWQPLGLYSNQDVKKLQTGAVHTRIIAKSDWEGFPSHFKNLILVYELTFEETTLFLKNASTGKPIFKFVTDMKVSTKTPAQINTIADAFKFEPMQFKDAKTDEKMHFAFSDGWRFVYINPKGQRIGMTVKSVDPNKLVYKAYFNGKPAEIYTFTLDSHAMGVYKLDLINPDGSRQTFVEYRD